MKILLDHGARVNIADNSGVTALHLAAIHGSLSRVNVLIGAGAHMCARNNAGKSALHFMMKHVPNSVKSIQKLLDGGLKINNVDNDNVCQIKMDFTSIVPPAVEQNHFESEVGLFNEVLTSHTGDPGLIEKILMHPLSQG